MNLFEEEIVSFFILLNKHQVKYILVGGLAVNYHGYVRSTGDVDLWLEDTPGNRKKLVSAFKEFEIEGAEMFLDYPLLAGYSEVLLGNGIYIDMMADLAWFKQKNFEESYRLADNFEMENVTVKVIHINKLIEEKENSKRLKDADDAEQLKKLRNKK